MNYCRFAAGKHEHWGVLENDNVQALSAAPWLEHQRVGEAVPRGQVRLLAPVTPSKIVCVGRNYASHAAELGNQPPAQPLIFLKPPSSVIGPDDEIIYPPQSQRVDYEGELGLVIGRRCHSVRREGALEYVFGFTCINDVTARDLQKADGQFTRAKGFDTFCPAGPVIVTGLDPATLTVETCLNGERRQRAPVSDMIFPPGVIIEFISGVMTLEPGDLIATGTPAGVGPMQPGDTAEVSIEGIGRLRNQVVAATN